MQNIDKTKTLTIIFFLTRQLLGESSSRALPESLLCSFFNFNILSGILYLIIRIRLHIPRKNENKKIDS
jgi:hypothetical protein